jgi:hypothetical protein
MTHGIDFNHPMYPMVHCNLPMGQILCQSCKDHGQGAVDKGIEFDHLKCPMVHCYFPMTDVKWVLGGPWAMQCPLGLVWITSYVPWSITSCPWDTSRAYPGRTMGNAVSHGISLDHLICPMVHYNLPIGQVSYVSWKDHGQGVVDKGIEFDHLKCPMVHCYFPMGQKLCGS